MEEKKLASFLQQAAKVLSDFLPLNSLAFFPLLYSTLVWALNQAAQVKAKILELEVWLEPDILMNKPEEFILSFFTSNPALKNTYAEELSRRDLKSLRRAFRVLYPLLGLEDPFLQKLFSRELDQGNYRLIVDDFEARLNRALTEIKVAQQSPGFWENLEKMGKEFLNLGWSLLNEAEIRKQLRQMLDQMTKEN